MMLSVFRIITTWYRPLLVALFNPSIPFHLRWRTLLLQPITLLTYSINALPYLFSRPFTVEYLPIFPSHAIRAIVFKHPGTGKGRSLRPLHVEIHGGSFIGGLAESSARFDERLAKETGAVVVSITYRFAPEHTFPCAIDDVDAAIKWIQEHAGSRWGADATLMTVSGFSCGGNLAMAATQQRNCQMPARNSFKAAVTFYGALDLRLEPWKKPKPVNYPKSDPLQFLLPLFDAYAQPARAKHMDDPRLNPVLARTETLPERVLLVVAAIDILYAEQMAFKERINKEAKRDMVETFVAQDGFHGYLEVPDAVVKKEVKDEAFTRAVEFLKRTYSLHGWDWA
ncbi:Alpha/beta hydrolase fold-3 [Metarhizium brunneum]